MKVAEVLAVFVLITIVATLPQAVGANANAYVASTHPAQADVQMPGVDTPEIHRGIQASSVDSMAQCTNCVVGSISVGEDPEGMVYDSSNGDTYVANHLSKNVSVISGASEEVIATVQGVSGPTSLAYDSANGEIYVAGGGMVSVISGTTNTLITTVTDAGVAPQGVAYDPTNGAIYVADSGSSSSSYGGGVSVILGSNNSVSNFIPLKNGAYGVTFDSGNGDLYVITMVNSAPYRGTVNVISAANDTVVATIPVGLSPTSVLSDPLNGDIYVTNWGSGNMSVILGATNSVTTIPFPTGNSAADAALDSANGDLYVTTPDSGNVTIVNGSTNTILGLIHVGVGDELSDAVFDPGNGFVYVDGWYGPNDYGIRIISPSGTRPAPVVTIAPTRQSVDANETVLFQVRVIFETSPLTFVYTPSAAGAGCQSSVSPELNCTPQYSLQGMTFNVSVKATDSYGGTTIAISTNVRVFPALSVTYGLSNSTPTLGQSIALSAEASGGLPPYTYAYTGLPPGCVPVNMSSIGCLPTQAGSYSLSVRVTDMNGQASYGNFNLQVVFEFTIETATTTQVDSPWTISVSFPSQEAQGGLTYNYSGLPPGCASSDLPSITCKPTAVGTYSVTVSVHDAAGDHSTQLVVVHVTEGVLGLPGDEGYFVLGAVVTVAAAVVVMLLFRRWRQPLPTEASRKGASEESSEKEKREPSLHPR